MFRILVSAYACEPGRGGEGEIGWSLVHELAKHHHVWVITRANNKNVHDSAFRREPKPERLNILYYDLPNWFQAFKQGKRFFLIYYYLWQLGSVLAARRLLAREEIDLVHHLTGGMDWMPSGLAFLGKPFLWGPVGSEAIHPIICRSLPFGIRMKEIFRNFLIIYYRQMDPFVRLTGSRANIILSSTPEHLPLRYQKKMLPYIQTGIQPTGRFGRMKPSLGRKDTFTVMYAGELKHWKGSSYAVEAFLEFAERNRNSRLKVIGDGPLRVQLHRKVAESGLERQVEFMGRVTMDVLIEELALGDVFLYPCYHHGLATVVLQAMFTGLPVICLEGDAIGRAVGSDCGITVPLSKNGNYVHELANAISRLHLDEKLRVSLAKRAQEVAIGKYSYQVIGEGYDAMYKELVSSNMCAKV